MGERESLKLQINDAITTIRGLQSKIDISTNKMDERAKQLLQSAGEYYGKQERERATLYANEVALIRSLSGKLSKSRLVLEVIELRLETVVETEDLASTLRPAIDAIKNVKNDIGPIIPKADELLAQVNGQLSDILATTFHTDVKSVDTVIKTSSAEEVMSEVRAMLGAGLAAELPTPPETESVALTQSQEELSEA